jgi:hypothetical protein
VRFYAFAAKDRQLAKELPLPDGTVHGVFTTTLLQGLRGHARDRVTGAVTTAQLKRYLQDNMQKLLPDADLDNDEIAKVPEIFDPDPFDILPSPPLPAVPEFPVRINLPQPGLTVHLEDSSFQKVDGTDPAPQVWQLRLPRGLYKVVAGSASVLFEVTGTVEADNTERVVDVRV